MAKVFHTWTVLPHGPIEKLSENVWRVQGTMPNPEIRRVMTIARMRDGRLFIHNAIALEEPSMAEIEGFGTPAIIVVPNGFHRQDAKIFKDRYPSAAVYAPARSIKKVSQVVPVTGDYDAAPKDDTVALAHLRGCKAQEGVLTVKSSDGTTVVFNDAIANIPKRGGIVGYLLGPTGKPSVPRFGRWMLVKNQPEFVKHVHELATPDLKRVIVSHGAMLAERPADALRTITSEL